MFAAASPFSSAATSSSLCPSGRLSAGKRSASGTRSNNSSSEPTPIAASIASRSESVCGMYVMYRWLLNYRSPSATRPRSRAALSRGRSLAVGAVLGVGRGVHQVIDVRRFAQLDLDDPAVAKGVAVDRLGRVVQRRVDRDDLATGRGVDIRRGLNTLDRRKRLTFGHRVANVRQFDKHQIGQVILGVVGEADPRRVAADANPFVVLGIFQILGGFPVCHIGKSFLDRSRYRYIRYTASPQRVARPARNKRTEGASAVSSPTKHKGKQIGLTVCPCRLSLRDSPA